MSRLIASGYVLPSNAFDQYGNPVLTRHGLAVDPASGYPLEIWKLAPRIEFVFVPAGQFMMGTADSDPVRSAIIGFGVLQTDESPRHLVRISRPFYMAKYEITWAQWRAVMDGSALSETPDVLAQPVEGLSYEMCAEFCRRTGLVLPTEAEWEYACRAGSETRLCNSLDLSDLDTVAWFGSNSEGKAHPVGMKKPNAWGIYDMHGNVEEVCIDTYKLSFYSDPEASLPDPLFMGNGQLGKVARGGSYLGWDDCRSASRAIAGHLRNGFRPVLLLGD